MIRILEDSRRSVIKLKEFEVIGQTCNWLHSYKLVQ